MSNPEIPVIETISESIFKRSPVSKSVASATVSVVSVAENVVSVTVVVSILFFNDVLVARTTFTDPPYNINCAAENQYS